MERRQFKVPLVSFSSDDLCPGFAAIRQNKAEVVRALPIPWVATSDVRSIDGIYASGRHEMSGMLRNRNMPFILISTTRPASGGECSRPERSQKNGLVA